MTSLGWPIPPRPASFSPTGAPAGVEVRFVDFYLTRPWLSAPLRSAFVHTNGANGEGSVDSAWNWAHAKPNQNTCPHYQVDRTHNGVTRARKMLPSNMRAIANATVDSVQDGRGDVAWWSLAIETADEGWGPGKPGGASGFDDQQGEVICQILAYEAMVSPALPIRLLDEWYGSGIAGHTDPFGYPYTTLARGKACPGDAKKRDVREWIIPRTLAIYTAWLQNTDVIVPPINPPVDSGPIGAPARRKKNKMIQTPGGVVLEYDGFRIRRVRSGLAAATGEIQPVSDQAAYDILTEPGVVKVGPNPFDGSLAGYGNPILSAGWNTVTA